MTSSTVSSDVGALAHELGRRPRRSARGSRAGSGGSGRDAVVRGAAPAVRRRHAAPRIQKLTPCDTRCYARGRPARGRGDRSASRTPADRVRPLGALVSAVLALPGAAQARPASARQGRPPEHPRRDDRRPGHRRRRADAERAAAARQRRARRSPTRSTRSRSAARRGPRSSPASTPTTTAWRATSGPTAGTA